MKKGYFGQYGGRFVPETLMPALIELEQAYLKYRKDKDFQKELAHLQKTYIGRPTSLYFAKRFTEHIGGAKIYLKREDLAHTGAHKINNALGQALLANRIGKKESLLKQAPDSMELQLPQALRLSALSARYTWALLI